MCYDECHDCSLAGDRWLLSFPGKNSRWQWSCTVIQQQHYCPGRWVRHPVGWNCCAHGDPSPALSDRWVSCSRSQQVWPCTCQRQGDSASSSPCGWPVDPYHASMPGRWPCQVPNRNGCQANDEWLVSHRLVVTVSCAYSSTQYTYNKIWTSSTTVIWTSRKPTSVLPPGGLWWHLGFIVNKHICTMSCSGNLQCLWERGYLKQKYSS